MAGNRTLDEICNELRSRICSGQLRGGDILSEEALAREFSLSRTPIRQVLHRLALEHFVETRSGVGTLVVPEDRSDVALDLTVYKDLLGIAAKNATPALGPEDGFELSGLSAYALRLEGVASAVDIWEYFYRASTLLARQTQHDLIAETSVLLGSRIFRRLITSLDGRLDLLAGVAVAEYRRAGSARTGRALIEARLDSLAAIRKLLPRNAAG